MLVLRTLGLRGRRTGVAINASLLKKDGEGFDDISSFWDVATAKAAPPTVDQFAGQLESPPEAAVSPAPTRNLDFLDGRASAASARGGGGGEEEEDDDSLGGGDEGNDFMYDYGNDEEEEERAETPLASRRSSEAPSQAPSSGASSVVAARRTSVDSEDEGETEEERDLGVADEANESLSDGGTSEGGANASEQVEDEEEARADAAVVSEYDDDQSRGRVHGEDEEESSGRRSRRTRYPPLAYWKNERYVYERPRSGVGEVLPVVAGVSERSKTPVAPRRQPQAGPRGRKRAAEAAPLDAKDLPKGLTLKKGDKSRVWHDKDQAPRKIRVVCRAESMAENEHELPLTTERGRHESQLVGSAAQAFFTPPMSADTPGWISGYVALPPKAIKDAEGVGVCSQLFFVAECQGNSLEVAVALPKDKRVRFDGATAQRFLLSAGDQFFVPPHNVYRLENHSTLKEAKLFWTIIKPVEVESAAANSDDDE